MKAVYECFGLLLLACGAWSATVANLGASCASGDTCSVNGAVCDKATSTCQCNHGYVQSGSICSRTSGMLCGQGMCKNPNTMMCTSGQCKCDTTKGYAVSGSDCACATNYVSESGTCKKVTGQSCSAASECAGTASGVICDTTCKCDTSKNFAANTAAASCTACVTNYVLEGGTCKKVTGQSCSAASDCAGTASGVICDTTCKCDTSKNFDANTGAASCTACVTNYVLEGGTCKKKIGESCSAASDCAGTASGVICDTTCKCDTSKNFDANTGAASCTACVTNYVLEGGTCKKVIGQSCSAASDCAGTASGVICDTTCKCDTSKNFAANTGAASCAACITNYVLEGSTCKKSIGQACAAASECAGTASGVICSTTCLCDSSKNLAAGTSGTGSCTACTANYLLENGICKLKVDQACTRTASTNPCVKNAFCDKVTDTCKCDDAGGWVVNAGKACDCTKSGYLTNGRGSCSAALDGFCVASTTSGVCVSGASCFAGNSTLDQQCLCSGTTNADGTCSGGAGLIASLAVLMAVLVTSRML